MSMRIHSSRYYLNTTRLGDQHWSMFWCSADRPS